MKKSMLSALALLIVMARNGTGDRRPQVEPGEKQNIQVKISFRTDSNPDSKWCTTNCRNESGLFNFFENA